MLANEIDFPDASQVIPPKPAAPGKGKGGEKGMFTVPGLGRKKKEAKLIGICYSKDIALLESITYNSNSYLQLGNSDDVKEEDVVITVGYPLGLSVKRTKGIISGRQEQYIQTDAPINPGNSGGPLINSNNEVIGINSAKISAEVADNIGYSIPINSYKVIKDTLMNNNKILINIPSFVCDFNNSDEYLLKYMNTPNSCREGYYIKKIYKTSPLYNTGITNGDIICSFDNHNIDNYGECNVPWTNEKVHINYLLHRYKIGDVIPITYWSYNKYNKKNPIDIKKIYIEFKDIDYYKLNFLYPPINKFDYEIFGGMVLTPLTLNHIQNLSDSNVTFTNSLNLKSYIKKKNRMKNRIILTNLLAGSYLKSIDILKSGDIIKRINNIKVRTISDVRKALIKPIIKKNNNYITIKSKTGTFVVLNLNKIVKEEEYLCSQHKYKQSDLYKNIEYSENSKIKYKLIISS